MSARPLVRSSARPLVLGLLVLTPTLAPAQVEHYTRSALFPYRHNAIDANYGHVCYGGNSVPEYEEFGFQCETADGTGFVSKQFDDANVVEVAVGHGGRYWYIRESGELVIMASSELPLVVTSTLPPGGKVSNMWTHGVPKSVPLLPNFFPPISISINGVGVQMEDGSIWELDVQDSLIVPGGTGWVLLVPPGEPRTYAGTWWDNSNGTSRMTLTKQVVRNGAAVWELSYCQPLLPFLTSPIAICVPGLEVPADQVAEREDPFSDARTLSISQESYFENRGLYSRILVQSYPEPGVREWREVQNWEDVVESNGEIFVSAFYPHYLWDETSSGEFIFGSRGFSKFDGYSNTTVFGPAAPLAFYQGDFGRQHVVLHSAPLVFPLPYLTFPAWQRRSVSYEFWERGLSQPMLRSFALSAMAVAPTKPWIVYVDEFGGPVYQSPIGWHEIPSTSRDTHLLPAVIEDEIALDVFVPAEATGWIGGIQLSGEVASAGVYGTYIGDISLNNIARGEWVEIRAALPSSLRNALRGNYPGAMVRTFVNAGVEGIQVRGLRTTGGGFTQPRSSFVHGTRPNVDTFPLFDFEEDGWTSPTNNLMLDAMSKSSGDYSALIDTGGWSEIVSRDFATSEIPALGDKLAIDVFAPESLPNPYWGGALQAYLTCPSEGVWSGYIGQVDLTHLYLNAWNTVEILLPVHLRDTLESDANDCSLKLTLNVHQGLSMWHIDRIGFTD